MTGGGGERAIERADYRLTPRAAASPVDGPAADVPARSWRGAVRRTLPPLLILGLGLAIWEVWVRLDDTPAWLLPPPSAIGRTLIDDRALLARHAEVTLLEVVLGFALALIAGVLLAVAIDASPAIERAIYPLIVASQTVPIPALAPLLLVWFGYGLLPKVLVAALVAFFPITVNTVDGLRGSDREVLQLLRSLGANAWTRFRLAKAPSALPSLFSGARIGIAVAVIGAVFGELVGASEGLGYLTTRAAADFNTARVFAAIVVLAVMGIVLFALVALAERLLLPWRRYLLDRDAG
jgi:ABC-type nitrate/sulfonate/bicarbonate transport system permease component